MIMKFNMLSRNSIKRSKTVAMATQKFKSGCHGNMHMCFNSRIKGRFVSVVSLCPFKIHTY